LKQKILLLTSLVVCFILIYIVYFRKKTDPQNDRFITYIINPKEKKVKLYWKNEQQVDFKSIENLKKYVTQKNETLIFAMNAGMYKPDHTPQGLYIENKSTLFPLDTSSGTGNFYLKHNGIFYINVNNVAKICASENFTNNNNIKYATQSGPMLVIDGKIHDSFKIASANLNIRNGVAFYLIMKYYLLCQRKKSIFMTSQNILKTKAVLMHYILMDLFPELICQKRIGYKQMVTLGL
jgi:uncharacterized protein YigE (DUF2233 family)